jgi:hypothetical protein
MRYILTTTITTPAVGTYQEMCWPRHAQNKQTEHMDLEFRLPIHSPDFCAIYNKGYWKLLICLHVNPFAKSCANKRKPHNLYTAAVLRLT